MGRGCGCGKRSWQIIDQTCPEIVASKTGGAMSKPWQPVFNSFSDAIYYAAQAAKTYTKYLGGDRNEFGSWIYKVGNLWTYTHPALSKQTNQGFLRISLIPKPENPQAIVHSHPKSLTAPGIFSPEDVSAAIKEGVPVFLITPWGLIRGYDPETDRFIELKKRLWQRTPPKTSTPAVNDPDNLPHLWKESQPPLGINNSPFGDNSGNRVRVKY